MGDRRTNVVQKTLITESSLASPYKNAMRRFKVLAVLTAVVTVGLFSTPAYAVAAAQSKRVTFSAHYSGTASLLINNSTVTISSVRGTGTGTPSLIGASTVTGSGSGAAMEQCDPFSGSGAITGAASSITLRVVSSSTQGCSSGESGPVTVSFHGVASATGTSGKAKGANGSLEFSGSLKLANTTGSQSGSISVTFSGKLTVKA
jgi:hypothetical protein